MADWRGRRRSANVIDLRDRPFTGGDKAGLEHDDKSEERAGRKVTWYGQKSDEPGNAGRRRPNDKPARDRGDMFKGWYDDT